VPRIHLEPGWISQWPEVQSVLGPLGEIQGPREQQPAMGLGDLADEDQSDAGSARFGIEDGNEEVEGV